MADGIVMSLSMYAGQAIYLRWPSRYHLAEGEPTSFGQIEELCRMKSETAIGYITEVKPCQPAACAQLMQSLCRLLPHLEKGWGRMHCYCKE